MFYIFIAIGALYVFGMFKQAAQEKGFKKWQWAFAGLFTFPIVVIIVSSLLVSILSENGIIDITSLVIIDILSIFLGGLAVRFLYKKLLSLKSKLN